MNAPAPRRFRSPGLLRLPAVRALLLQCLSFPLTLGTVWLLARAGVPMSYLAAALIQGAWAALLSWRARLASWWCVIGFCFAPAPLNPIP